MLTLEDFRFFNMVAQSRTLAAAARALDVTPPAVSQRLRQLEGRLRLRLVDRSTRHLILTDEGELLAARGRRILQQVDEVQETLSTRRGAVTGHLRVVAPFGFGRKFVAPALAAFQADSPEATSSLILSENPYQLPSESWDVLVHLGELRESTLISQRLAPNERIVCASPAYVAARGAPRTPEDLRRHDCVALRENDEDVTLWRFTDPAGSTATIRIDPVMSSNDGDTVRSWALEGRGVIIRSEWDVVEDLASGDLVRVLTDLRPPPADVRVLLGERSSRAARTRDFVDRLKAALSPPPWRTLSDLSSNI